MGTPGNSERQPLVGGTEEIMGQKMTLDDASWHYCMVFPLETTANSAEMSKSHPDPMVKAQALFTKRAWQGDAGIAPAKDAFQPSMTNKEFHVAVRNKVVDFLSGVKCGFKLGTKVSIDEDEVFLLIELSGPPKAGDPNPIEAIADRQEVRMAVKDSVYPKGADGKPCCPTIDIAAGKFVGTSYCPQYAAYDIRHKTKFADFREVDLIRMVKKRMKDFLVVEQLLDQGVVLKIFPVHKFAQVDKLKTDGWSRITACCQFPGIRHTDNVRDYFGEEVAFFFHWFNFYTRFLILPATIGFALFFRQFFFDLVEQRLLQMGFAVFMCIWSAFFTELYNLSSKVKIQQWGMFNYASVATTRPTFKPEKRGTWGEFFQNAFHWVLVILFVVETLYAVAFISNFRMEAAHNPEKIFYFGLNGAKSMKLAKYLVTANIKLVDQVWKRLSPLLTSWENHKTEEACKSAMVGKLFIVKFIIYYYPFWYTAFLKEHIEGCPDTPAGCIPELVQNLEVFFVTHIGTVMALIAVPMITTRLAIRGEVKAAEQKKAGATYSYLQAQAKSPAFEDDTDDFMELILSLGFVMMFSVVLPVMSFLAFFSNMLEIRLLGYRMAHVMQRADPRGQEGIGAWAGIVQVISTFAVICNVGLAVFAMHPLRDFDLPTKLGFFVALEHLMLCVKNLVEAAVPDKSLTLTLIEEVNTDSQDEIFGDIDKPVNVQKTDAPNMPIKA